MEGKPMLEEHDLPMQAQPAQQAKPAAQKTQLDAFANKTAQRVQHPAEVVDVDPETGEVLEPDFPNIPNDALNDWETSGKWMKGWKWFSMQLPEVPPASRPAFVERHREMLSAVAGHGKYGEELRALFDSTGVTL